MQPEIIVQYEIAGKDPSFRLCARAAWHLAEPVAQDGCRHGERPVERSGDFCCGSAFKQQRTAGGSIERQNYVVGMFAATVPCDTPAIIIPAERRYFCA